MFGNLLDSVVSTASDFAKDPIGSAVDMVTQPIVDTIDLIDGLSEGELREKAAIRLGADIALGTGTSELIEWYSEL